MRVWMAMVKSSGPSGSPCWSCRRDGGASKAEMGWVVVTPCHPAANAGEVGCSSCRYCSARDAIEDIGEVEFDQHFARGRLAPSSPSPGSVDSNPDTSFHPDSGSGVLLYHLHPSLIRVLDPRSKLANMRQLYVMRLLERPPVDSLFFMK